MKHPISDCLRRNGYTRSDWPADEIGECVASTGCSRVGRWTQGSFGQQLCAQHAHEAVLWNNLCPAARRETTK